MAGILSNSGDMRQEDGWRTEVVTEKELFAKLKRWFESSSRYFDCVNMLKACDHFSIEVAYRYHDVYFEDDEGHLLYSYYTSEEYTIWGDYKNQEIKRWGFIIKPEDIDDEELRKEYWGYINARKV